MAAATVETRVPQSDEVKTYEQGLKDGKKEAKTGEGRSTWELLGDDIVAFADAVTKPKEDKKKKPGLLARTLTETENKDYTALLVGAAGDAAKYMETRYAYATEMAKIGDFEEADRVVNSLAVAFIVVKTGERTADRGASIAGVVYERAASEHLTRTGSYPTGYTPSQS